jgi:hypothetical protein
MKLVSMLGCAAVALMASVGCCHTNCQVVDPCDPCGALGPRRGCMSWMGDKIHAWRSRHSCCSSGCASGCPTMGCGDYGMQADSGSCGAPPILAGGMVPNTCSCAAGYAPATQATPSEENLTPTLVPAAEPDASDDAPMPPDVSTRQPQTNPPVNTTAQLNSVPYSATSAPAPTRVAAATSQQPLSAAPPQVVTYEEFQRLPGVIISGPGAQTAPTATAAAVPASPLPPSPMALPIVAPPTVSQPVRVIPAGASTTVQTPPVSGWVPARR